MVELQATGRLTLGVSVAMQFLATLALVLRFIAGLKTEARLRVQDVLICLAYASFTAHEGVFLNGVYTAGGTLDLSQMTGEQLANIYKAAYIMEALFTASITLVKLSILFLYRFIFPVPKLHCWTAAIGAFCTVWFLVCFFVSIFECRPIEAGWNPKLVALGQTTCIDYGNYLIGYELSNMALDIAILCLPVWMIKRLQLSTARKIAIGVIFLFGGFVSIICIIRTGYLHSLSTKNPNPLTQGLNWGTVELAVAITCACIPCLGPLIPTTKLTDNFRKWHNTHESTRNITKIHNTHGLGYNPYLNLENTAGKTHYLTLINEAPSRSSHAVSGTEAV